MNITPVTYKQACEILDCKYSTLAAAADRGVFTRLSVTGPEQKIIREQVEIFKGKKKLTLATLSREERKIWEQIEDSVSPRSEPLDAQFKASPSPSSVTVNMDPDQFVKALIHNGVVTPGHTINFHSALAGETDSKEEEQDAGTFGMLFLVVILLGLLWLFAQETKTRAAKVAERTLEQIGLEKEDLAVSQREAIETLRQHPKEAKKLKHIIDREGYPDPLTV